MLEYARSPVLVNSIPKLQSEIRILGLLNKILLKYKAPMKKLLVIASFPFLYSFNCSNKKADVMGTPPAQASSSTFAWNGIVGLFHGSGLSAEFNLPMTILAGNGNSGFVDGALLSSEFNTPSGLGLDPSGNMYVADYGNERIRKLVLN